MDREKIKNIDIDVKKINVENPLLASKMSTEQNYNMIDGILNNTTPEPTDIETRSAVHSNYEGLVALVGIDGNIYLGKTENYHYNFRDSPSYYDNSDESLLFVSHNQSIYQFLYSEGFVASQSEMLEYGIAMEDYIEYARLLDSVLKNLMLKSDHEFFLQANPLYIQNQKSLNKS